MTRTSWGQRGDGRRTVSSLIVGCAVLASAWVGAGAAAAVETETFSLAPSPLTVQGFERRSFAFDPEVGGTAGDAIRIANRSDEPRRFRLYGADARRDPRTGAVAVEAASVEPRGVGSWVEFERDEITLPPRASEVVSFTLTRPSGTTAEGLGAVVAEEIVDQSEVGGIDVVYRLALLIRLDGDVAGVRVGAPSMDPPVELFPSRSTATVELTNDTLQPVRATVRFSTAGLTGRYWELGEQEVRLQAGESRDVTATWDTVPRWGGLFEPAVSVAWERGSIVRTGSRALHPPLWLLGLAIAVVGTRAVRELRTGAGDRTPVSEPAPEEVQTPLASV